MHPFLFAVVLTAAPQSPADLIDDVRPLFALVTCQPTPLPAGVDAKVVARYCDAQRPRFERFRKHWGTTARGFLVSKQPKDLPTELVYPFGGGDLMSALMAFPDAQVITTLSLELAGDPRRAKALEDPKALAAGLTALLQTSASTLLSNDSKSVNLSRLQQGALPGQLAMHLLGLGLFDLEPTHVRYFRVEPDGALHYFTPEELAEQDGATAAQLKASWRAPDFSAAFANVEVQFAPRGQPGPVRTFRHLAANLSDEGLAQAPGVVAHWRAKGRVAAMTKAASYLLWRDTFSTVRELLVANSAFMVSDSTGVPPRHWKKRGCTVDAYGSFEKSFLGTWEPYQAELRELFAHAPKVPMRFGYPDGSPQRRNHLLVVTCPD